MFERSGSSCVSHETGTTKGPHVAESGAACVPAHRMHTGVQRGSEAWMMLLMEGEEQAAVAQASLEVSNALFGCSLPWCLEKAPVP